MKFHVFVLGFALLCLIPSSESFKKKERLALAFLAGMVFGQHGRQASNYPVPIPWPVQAGGQVIALPLAVPLRGHSASDKKVFHNIVQHHQHIKGQHQLDSAETLQQSEWPQKFGHSEEDLGGFGGKLGGNVLGSGFDTFDGLGSSDGGDSDFDKKVSIKQWDHRSALSSPLRRRYLFSDYFADDLGNSFGSFSSVFPKYALSKWPLLESDNKWHALLPDSASLKAAESTLQSTSKRASSTIAHPPTFTKSRTAEKPPAVRTVA